mgnify:CR=1 FL=1
MDPSCPNSETGVGHLLHEVLQIALRPGLDLERHRGAADAKQLGVAGDDVADVDVHVVWHGPTDLPPGQEARLRFGHPRDWPKTPGAPEIAPQTEPPLEQRA